VKLTWDPTSGLLSGEVDLAVTATDDRATFDLDSDGPTVSKVTVDGTPATFTASGGELRITPTTPLAKGSQSTVDVTYSVHPDGGTSEVNLPSGWFPTAGGSYVLDEPDGTRTWLPSSDHPSDKATWTFEITVPSGVVAVANGKHVSTTPGPKGDTWVWREDRPMATYLIQVLTGSYDLIEATGPHGLPLLSAVLHSAHAKMQSEVDEVASQIAFFEQSFGPYPLDRYGIAVTDSAPGLAMETQERSMFSEGDLTGSKGYEDELLLSHELAHQWFGDAVSPQRWKDVWLNESFATYGQWMWLDHQHLATLTDLAQQALDQRRFTPGKTADPSLDELFGQNVYEGGAIALQALRLKVGDSTFFTVLRDWVQQYNGTSRTTDDFVHLASQVAGSDLTSFFHQWLYSDTPPSTFPGAAGGGSGTGPTTTDAVPLTAA
jgi:aminopeptidase N